MVRVLACHAKSRGFESRFSRFAILINISEYASFFFIAPPPFKIINKCISRKDILVIQIIC